MRTTDLKSALYRSWHILLIPLLLMIFFIIAIKLVNPIEYPNSDFFTFWLSGRLAFLGENPYDSQIWITGHHQYGATWIPNATFIYPLPISLLFTPLGLLPLYQAFIIWDTLTQVMIFASVILLVRANSNMPTKPLVLPLVAGIILFRPTIVTLVNGQLSGMLLLLISCVIYLWEKGKWWQGSIPLAMLALKPNLGVPLILLLAIFLMQKRKIMSLFTGTLSGVFLLFLGWLQNPNWVVSFWNAGNTKLSQIFGFAPTIWGVTGFFCKYNLNCTISYGLGIAAFFLIIFMYLLIKKQENLSPSYVVSLAIVTMLLVTPSCWPYDQLLLIAPIVLIMTSLLKDGHKYLPVALIFIAIDILGWILFGFSAKIQREIWNVGIPLFIFGFLVWLLISRSPAQPKRAD